MTGVFPLNEATAQSYIRTRTTGIVLWINNIQCRRVDVDLLFGGVNRKGSSLQAATVETHQEVGSGRQDTGGRG